MKKVGIFGASGLAFIFFAGCAGLQPPAPSHVQIPRAVTAPPRPRAKPSWWDDAGASGARSIVIHLGDQRAFFFKGKKAVGESTISTGRKGFETPPGTYHVIQKDKNHVSNLYGDYVNAEG